MIRKFGTMALGLVAFLALGGTTRAAVIYGIGDRGQIVQVDLASLTETTLYTPAPTVGNGNALAIDSAGKNLYYRLPANGSLYRYDLTSPLSPPVALSFPSSVATISNASWYDGSYWAVRDGSNDIYRVNFGGGGNITTVDTLNNFNSPLTGGFSFGDIAITTAGRLYGTTSNNRFFRVDIAGGSASNYTLIDSNVGDTLQIALDPTQSFLYAHSHNSGKWWTMDLTNGDLTPIMKGGTQFTTTKLRDIASAAVPEPASIAMASFGGLFGLGLMARRRLAARRV
jgi:hypothetical protein